MWEPDPSRFTHVNVEGTRNVMEAALETGVKKVVYVSTVAVYGKPEEAPFTEESRPGPRFFSEYGHTKAIANEIAWDAHRRGLPLVVFYPGIVLGAGDEKASGHYIQDIIRRRVPSTIFHHSRATYVYVGDLVEAMLRAAEKPEAIGQKYLIGCHTLDGRAYAKLISEVSGVPLPLFRFPDWMVLSAAYLLTAVSQITHRPPLWGLSIDAGWTLKNGFFCDGSKVEHELGIHYTPIRVALEEAITSYRALWRRASKNQK
jgi:dihydroflavonol-4-reductase